MAVVYAVAPPTLIIDLPDGQARWTLKENANIACWKAKVAAVYYKLAKKLRAQMTRHKSWYERMSNALRWIGKKRSVTPNCIAKHRFVLLHNSNSDPFGILPSWSQHTGVSAARDWEYVILKRNRAGPNKTDSVHCLCTTKTYPSVLRRQQDA